MPVRHMWVPVLLVMLATACSSVPETHYFTMSYVLLSSGSEDVSPYPATLRVRMLDIAPAYDMERIVYRYSPYEFQYYNYMQWATKPQKMVTDLLMRHLRHARLFYHVGQEYRDRHPDYELHGVLNAIEEIDSGDEWYAHLGFSLRMTRYRDERVVWSYDADRKKRVYNKEPVYVVKALSELMEEEMKKIVVRLRKFLDEQGQQERERS